MGASGGPAHAFLGCVGACWVPLIADGAHAGQISPANCFLFFSISKAKWDGWRSSWKLLAPVSIGPNLLRGLGGQKGKLTRIIIKASEIPGHHELQETQEGKLWGRLQTFAVPGAPARSAAKRHPPPQSRQSPARPIKSHMKCRPGCCSALAVPVEGEAAAELCPP